MQNLKKYILASGVVCLLLGGTACKKNFGTINTDPSVVITPDIGFLLTYSEDQIMKYQYTEWIWESMEQLMRFTQTLTTDPYELTSNVNLRYTAFYTNILPNLHEIRRQISMKADSAAYQKAAAVTYVAQIMHALKVTDMNGSIPYTEASEGREINKFDPVYDKQQDLLNLFLTQLDNSIATLESTTLPNQLSFGNADVYFKGDWTKWVKLANSLKLRIAARLELQDNAKTSQIFQQVMTDANGPIVNDEDQLTYQSIDYLPFGSGGEITYRSQRFGTTSMIDFMKKVSDPRLPIYFEKNGLQGSYKDTLTKYGASLPSFIDPNDPLIAFQGGPADFTTNPSRAAFIKNSFSVGNNSAGNSVSAYFLISPVNRLFFSPKYNNPNGGGFYKEISVTATEGCLLIAEFIQKGYAGAVDTKGNTAYWYEKGITSSVTNMNQIAGIALSTTFSGPADAAAAAYIANPLVKLAGSNDLERIYIQEHLNFYRNPNEAFVFARRTGYPKFGSAYYARETMNELIPRRFWTIDPGETNRANWNAAMADQGFTPNAQDLPSLSSQRIWYDKTAPDFGDGN